MLTRSPGGGRPRVTRLPANFSVILGQHYPEPLAGRDARAAMLRVFRKCIPSPTSMFAGPISMHHLIHMNDYVLDKAFVYGAMMLSKWLGQDRLPHGVFGFWPPEPTPGAIPEVPAAGAADHSAE